MATLDQDDLNAIQSIVDNAMSYGSLRIHGISVRDWNPNAILFTLSGSFPPAGQTIELYAADFSTGAGVTLFGYFDENGTWNQDPSWTDQVTQDYALKIQIGNGAAFAYAGGTIQVTQSGVNLNPITLPSRPADFVGSTYWPLKDGTIRYRNGGVLFGWGSEFASRVPALTEALVEQSVVTLSQIEASPWLLKTKTEGQNAVEVDPDGDVIVKTRRQDLQTDFEPVSTMRQVRYLFKDFFGTNFLSSNPAITIHGWYELDGTTPKDMTGITVYFAGVNPETGFYRQDANPIGTWDSVNGFVNDSGFVSTFGIFFAISAVGMSDTGVILDWSINGSPLPTRIRHRIEPNSGLLNWITMCDGSTVGYGGRARWHEYHYPVHLVTDTVLCDRELITNTNPHQLVYREGAVEIARFNLTRDVNGNYISRTKV